MLSSLFPLICEGKVEKREGKANDGRSAVFVSYVSISLYSLLRPAPSESKLMDIESPSMLVGNEKWEMEMNSMARSPGLKNPMTPRTFAFNKLDGSITQPAVSGAGGRKLNRDLPLRHHISMGEEPTSDKGQGKGRWG